MKSKLNNIMLNSPTLFGGLFFLLFSFIFNLIDVLIFKSAHIYDIVHVFPTILIYEPIINALGGFKLNILCCTCSYHRFFNRNYLKFYFNKI